MVNSLKSNHSKYLNDKILDYFKLIVSQKLLILNWPEIDFSSIGFHVEHIIEKFLLNRHGFSFLFMQCIMEEFTL